MASFVTKDIYISISCLPTFPSAFSPNGDGHNDNFRGLAGGSSTDCPPEMRSELHIYDRWGNKVYSGDAYSPGWDGLIAGSPAPIGVYVYACRTRIGDEEKIAKGSITLLR